MRYSLGALLTAICAFLASPDVDDPLVIEIAELYVRDCDRYEVVAWNYTCKYARESQPPEFDDLDLDNTPGDQQAVAPLPCEPMNTDELSFLFARPSDSEIGAMLSHTTKSTFGTVK